MKLKGIERKEVTVEIDPKDIINAAMDLFDIKFPRPGEYIDKRSGKWMIYEYTHPHNRDDVYREGAIATSEELFLEQVRNVIEGLAK